MTLHDVSWASLKQLIRRGMYAGPRRWRGPETVRLRANTLLRARETCRLYLRHAAWMGIPDHRRNSWIRVPALREDGPLVSAGGGLGRGVSIELLHELKRIS